MVHVNDLITVWRAQHQGNVQRVSPNDEGGPAATRIATRMASAAITPYLHAPHKHDGQHELQHSDVKWRMACVLKGLPLPLDG